MQRLYVVSAHPLAAIVLVRILSTDTLLRGLLYPKPYANVSLLPKDGHALLVLDTSLLTQDAGSLCRLVRASNPELHCLLLLHPERSGEDEMLRLLYAGVDGCLSLSENLEEELPKAARGILDGKLWMTPSVLRKYVHQSNQLLAYQFNRNLAFTARESQVFQLVGRRLTNKEIANTLNISERTAKFHVSNVLAKLGVEKREAVFQQPLSARGSRVASPN